ncbi:MAG: hypothetical protein ACJ8BC_03375 [Gemmatimonadales bacterium]
MARVPLKLSPCAGAFTVSTPMNPLTLRSAAALCLGTAILGACHTDKDVAVRVSIPDAESRETPAAGVGIVALPYDRDSILASLEARARTPRPQTATLDTLFAHFRGPFTRYTDVSYRASQLRDSLDRLRRGLDSGSGSGSPQLERLADSVRALDRQVARARSQLDRARVEFVSRSEAPRAAVRRWEDSTYRGYDSIVENLARSQGRDAVTDTTGSTGWARFTLPAGHWWIYARAWDTSDPNAEWYWNVPVQEDTVLLSSRTGRRRPRY